MSPQLFSSYTLGDFHSTLLYVMREIVVKLNLSDTGTSMLWCFCKNVRHLYVVTFGEWSSLMRHYQIDGGKCLDIHVCGKASGQKNVE